MKGEPTGPCVLGKYYGGLSPTSCENGECTEVLPLYAFVIVLGALVCEKGIWITSVKLTGVNEPLHVTSTSPELCCDRVLHVTGRKPL